VGQIISWGYYTPENILRFAATAEVKLKHPIAKAIIQAYVSYNKPLDDIDDAHYQIGFGIKILVKTNNYKGGKLAFYAK
jgi:cation transport ATPase